MAYSRINIWTKDYWNRTVMVKIIVRGWAVSFFFSDTRCGGVSIDSEHWKCRRDIGVELACVEQQLQSSFSVFERQHERRLGGVEAEATLVVALSCQVVVDTLRDYSATPAASRSPTATGSSATPVLDDACADDSAEKHGGGAGADRRAEKVGTCRHRESAAKVVDRSRAQMTESSCDVHLSRTPSTERAKMYLVLAYRSGRQIIIQQK